jgi:hypothetical protein
MALPKNIVCRAITQNGRKERTMNKPDLIPPQENFELPEYIQEQIRNRQNQTPEQRSARVKAQRERPSGDVAPFTVREREYLRRALQEQQQKAE